MPSETAPPKRPGRYSVALTYALISATWIATSDYLFARFGAGAALQTAKGFAFVIVTSLLLHSLVQRYAARVREYDRELQESTHLRVLGQLNALVSHEMRNVLMSAKMMTAVARRHLTDAPQAENALRHLGAAYQRAEALLSEILTFAAPHAARTEPVVLRPWLDEFADWIRPTLRQNVRLDMAELAGDLAVHADPVHLHVLLTNLVMNANEALTGGGGITISAAAGRAGSTPGVTLSVRDDGPGIPPEVGRRVFEPLFTTRTAGTGLGLAIVERIMAAHNGSVTFESAVGKGTHFHAFFPDATGHPRGTP